MTWWTIAILREVLLGLYCDASPLSALRGHPDIVKNILRRVVDAWRAHVVPDPHACVRLGWLAKTFVNEIMPPGPFHVAFPAPMTAIIEGKEDYVPFHVNMLPFVMFDLSTVPMQCRRYLGLIESCLDCVSDIQEDQVGYLTIHESWVEPGLTQRRPGLHVEVSRPSDLTPSNAEVIEIPHWGGGMYVEKALHGGIFMASTVAGSCGVWSARVQDPQVVSGPLGDMEHLRTVLDKDAHGCTELEANELVWITDTTLHESLPVATRQFRQFFRLVTSQVTHWFAAHSTANPLGIQPPCKIIHGDKFDPLHEADTTKAPLANLESSL